MTSDDGTTTGGIPIHSTETGIPAMLGRYRVLQLLGEGGMGAVYKVEQDRPDLR